MTATAPAARPPVPPDLPGAAPAQNAKHPAGLYVLFFTEMWERFGFYLMVGILLLFLRDTVSNGGKGMSNAEAADIVGTYVALVYLTPFVGGLLADRYLGYRKSILLGGVLMSAGYFLLAIPGSNALMFAAFGVIIIGNGFFKPNISTLLGNLYNTEALKPKKDSAYNIFYMGINIGAFICNFVAAYMRHNYGWGFAFAAAGAGMALGVVIFLLGMRTVKAGDVIKPPTKEDMPFSKLMLYVFVPAIAAGTLGWFIPGNLIGSDSNDAFVAASIPLVGYFLSLWWRATGFERRRIGTVLIMFGVSVLFWNIYNQNATVLTLWVENYTERQMPKAIAPVVAPFHMAEVVTTTPHEVPDTDPQFRTKLGPDGHVLTHQGIDTYFQNIPPDQRPPPGHDLKLMSTELYQSINPFWIVLLTPVVVGFFGFLRARGKEPSTTAKMAWGTVISGVSSLVLVVAALTTNIYLHKVSSAWIFTSYGVFTVSELFLSPIGLSLVSKVAPRRLTALMMGGWFLTISLAGKMSGILAGFWDMFDSKALFFGVSAAAAIIAGFLLLPLTHRLAAVVDEATAAKE